MAIFQDTIGKVHVGANQKFLISIADYYLPLSFNVYQNGKIGFPDSTKIYNTVNYNAGDIEYSTELSISYATITMAKTSHTGTNAAGVFNYPNIVVMAGEYNTHGVTFFYPTQCKCESIPYLLQHRKDKGVELRQKKLRACNILQIIQYQINYCMYYCSISRVCNLKILQ